MLKEEPSDKPYRWAERIKEAKRNVRFIPFGYALVVGFGIYDYFFPVPSVPPRDKMLASFLMGGALLWMQSVYLDEKYFLKTGQERVSYGHTVGLFLCLAAFVPFILLDTKHKPNDWFMLIVLVVYFLNRIAKHVAPRAAQQPRR